MAAGLGSRYGGLKQLEPIDENNNFIIDYSIFDAIRCGFKKVVFIIKKENFELFRETIGKRIEKQIETEYVFQDNSNIPEKYNIPEDRQKPFGTGHAILCAKNAVKSNFAVINADDFYGYDAFKELAEFLKNNTSANQYSIIGYQAKNTISNNGTVNRGICVSKNGKLKDIIESKIELKNNLLFATPLSQTENATHQIEPNSLVSMNMFGFTPDFLHNLDGYFASFLETNKNDLSKCEFFLPTVVSNMIQEEKASVDLIQTTSKWYGITYKEDKEKIIDAISKMKEEKIYPNNLWQK